MKEKEEEVKDEEEEDLRRKRIEGEGGMEEEACPPNSPILVLAHRVFASHHPSPDAPDEEQGMGGH